MPLPSDATEISSLVDDSRQALAEPAPVVVQLVATDDTERLILAQLDGDALSADAIIERSGLPAQTVMQRLTLMSLKGLIRRVEGQTYARCGPEHSQ